MINIKQETKKRLELIIFLSIIIAVIVHAILRQDSYIALISAICGITYTSLAGKGYPICYTFGVIGSSFYSFLSFSNNLWGNLILYLFYYIPMQIIGYFKWKKNLHINQKKIIKIYLPLKELKVLIALTILGIILTFLILCHYNDKHPLLDAITTVVSISGMYLTVRRAIEQWIFWAIVNVLSLAMWINVALSGERVYSTIAMWAVYTILAIYFYLQWKKEIKNNF